MIRVTVWNEHLQDRDDENVLKIYPDGINEAIASYLRTDEELEIRTANMHEPECGLPDVVLQNTDVLIWWAHCGHDQVSDEIAENVKNRVLSGMGLIVLHSGHYSKPFKMLMGTSCSLRWRDGDFERIWCVNPGHPIAEGIPAAFTLDEEEMYGEHFDVPQPDELVFSGWFRGGELFRSGCCWNRGAGKVFYFQPGHETCPTYKNENILRIIKNAVKWARPINSREELGCHHYDETTEQRHAKGISETY
ncbi:MAG: ThuA domain-containing protein [Oscillospiraceae bacterium]